MPGGGVDEGESIAEAAVREVVEETGIEVRLTRMVGIYSMPTAKAWADMIILFFGKPVGGHFEAQEGEVVAIKYFPIAVIPEKLLFGHGQRIQDVLDGKGGSTVWRQNIPFDDVAGRRELYDLVEGSGMEGADFYEKYFGFETPQDDRCDIG
jgi:8-oxo-dGTP pyrophosphatase MutT (NUDIX family)